VLPVPPPRSVPRGWNSPRSSQASKVIGTDSKESVGGDNPPRTPSTPATSAPPRSPIPQTGTVWDAAWSRLQTVHRTLAQLEVAASLLTEASVALQQRVGIVRDLGVGDGPSSSADHREDSPPVTMTCEQLAVVGEPTNEQVTMWVADEVVWEAQREEWSKEGSGGEDTDYSAASGKSR
jgi:hypothetical protein